MNDRNKVEQQLRWTPNAKIDIWGKVDTENELKQTKQDFSKIGSMWAKVIPQTGKLQMQQAETVMANVSHKIEVRYEGGKGISEEMHIMCRGKRYDIKFILNPYMKNEFLEIFCEEVIE